MKWYPQDKEELNEMLDEFLRKNGVKKEIHGLIVPHAGYVFSGAVAGAGFCFLKNSDKKKAIVIGPSHYIGFRGVKVFSKDKIETPLGEIKIMENNFDSIENLDQEHSVNNQIPFLQKLGFKEVLPLVVGEINDEEAKEIAKKLSEIDAVYIFSTDLSHFLNYEEAVRVDKRSIKIIEELDFKNFDKIDACGIFPLLILMHLCKSKGWKPKLIEYKNSGDVTGDRSSVVGYASFLF